MIPAVLLVIAIALATSIVFQEKRRSFFEFPFAFAVPGEWTDPSFYADENLTVRLPVKAWPGMPGTVWITIPEVRTDRDTIIYAKYGKEGPPIFSRSITLKP